MQSYFVDSDTNGDGELDKEEANFFLAKAREYEQKPGIVENWGQFFYTHDNGQQKIDRHWNALYLLSSPRVSFTFQDYLRAEKIMEVWYNAGLL